MIFSYREYMEKTGAEVGKHLYGYSPAGQQLLKAGLWEILLNHSQTGVPMSESRLCFQEHPEPHR